MNAAENGTPARLLRLKEAATILSVTPRWIRKHREALGFVVQIAPGTVRVDAARMERWISGAGL